MSRAGVVWRAFAYLQAVSIFNALRERLKRLRQPRYLIGAIAGGAYIWFFLIRSVARPRGDARAEEVMRAVELGSIWESLAAAGLMVVVVLHWIVPGSRAALQFTEAEVAFLFPAPLTRRMLIHFKLLRSQLALLLSALLMTLVFRRGDAGAAGQWQYAIAWWLLFSNMSLHWIAASFARERLLDLGIDAWRRRWLIGALALAVAVGCGLWLREHIVAFDPKSADDPTALARWVATLLDQPPLPWLLAPFRWVVAPMFADGFAAFAPAAIVAFAVLLAHYLWVMHADTAFEEASIDLSRRTAERVSAIRGGKSAFYRAPTKSRGEPFRLAESGPAPFAFLWKGLIELGGLYRLRWWLIACAVILVGGAWLRADPSRKPLLVAAFMTASVAGVWLLLLGPMLMTRGLRNSFARLDILRAMPVDGRQIVFGELATPIVAMTMGLWLAALVIGQAVLGAPGGGLGGAKIFVFALGAILGLPPLLGLLLCAPMAGYVLFPAWTLQMGTRGGGIEMMGQRMIFFAAYLLLLIGALVPAAALGAVAFLAGHWLGTDLVAAILATLAVCATLAVEFIGAVQWLGDRLEDFDVSLEHVA